MERLKRPFLKSKLQKAHTGGRIDHFSNIFLPGHCTLTFEFDLGNVKMNLHAKCLGQRSCSLTVIVRTHTLTHTLPIALLGPLKFSVEN